MKSSPIQAPSGGKTLEEAKKDFVEKFVTRTDNLDTDPMNRYGGYDFDLGKYSNDVWKWFESTLSSLTEQMIPEEKNEPTMFDDIQERYIGFNQAISITRSRRDKLLGK